MLNLTIVDGFSGGGLYRLGNSEVDGSPLRLLRAVEAADQALKTARAKGFSVRADFFFAQMTPRTTVERQTSTAPSAAPSTSGGSSSPASNSARKAFDDLFK